MAKQMTSKKKNGFLYSGVSESQDDNTSPIYGYRDLSVTSLEESVKDVALHVPCIDTYIHQAKQNCYKGNPKLTLDESAAIYLYTMATPFHIQLNNTLRTENRDKLRPWLAFLKLFITAVGKLPTLPPTIVWRCVASDLSSNFVNNLLQTWWTVNSCSTDPKVAEWYLGGTGTVFGIQVIYGKDISEYSTFPAEKEVILMPGTRVQMIGQPLEVKDKPHIVSLKECTTIPQGKHVMLSYHSNDHKIVSEIYQILRKAHIPVWFEERRDLENNIRNSMADGVEDAAIVCYFITSDYEKSNNCQCELQYAQKRGRKIIPCLLTDTRPDQLFDWLKRITIGLIPINFHDISELNIYSKTGELIDQIKEQYSASHYLSSSVFDEPSYLFELIRQNYQRNSRIERIMNPSKSFPIEQSYINLAIVNAKEHQEKEKQLFDAQHGNNIIGAYEEIYGMKTVIDVKNMFDICKSQEKQVLVFGRAGIGKSTFCRYVAYQWATGSYWPQYELLALIPLRRLTINHYPPLPPGQRYSLIDLVKKEVFHSDLSEKDDMLLKNQFDPRKTVWILDGYDEIVQNVPSHLQLLFEQLLKTPHHILTSRPYMNALSYNVQMEVTGFTDKNIKEYVEQFFDQMKDEFDNASAKSQTLFRFLESNSSIWGIAHIPINLELICSCWSNDDWSETKQLTITILYSMITEWLCRRYLRTHDDQIRQLSIEDVERCCQKELIFLESLAFHAIESNTIILQPTLLKKALSEAKTFSSEHRNILNIGILKSFHKQGIGNRIEMNKDHYFIHLSFQEYFAARYLINMLNGSSNQRATEFIRSHKYNQRYTLLFIFASGLLSESDVNSSLNMFWLTILRGPFDLVGIRHIQFVIACIEETTDKSTIPHYSQLFEWIANCIKYNIMAKNDIICSHLSQSLHRAPSVTADERIINAFINLLQHDDDTIRIKVLSFISKLDISNPSSSMITSIIAALTDQNMNVRRNACEALGNISKRAATNQVISKLVSALGDEDRCVRWRASEVFRSIGEKAATDEVISKLVSTLGDEDKYVRCSACEALGNIGEKAATSEVIDILVSTLGAEDKFIRRSACRALGNIGKKATTNEVINKLVSALPDENEDVRMNACRALGNIGEKAATHGVINKLVSALPDENEDVKRNACKALGKIGGKATTNELISILVIALGDERISVRENACNVLGTIGEKIATNEVISKLVSALEDEDEDVRRSACRALGNLGEKAATNEVISKLVSALGDESLRWNACAVLGKIGEKAATNEVISKLVSALEDVNGDVRLFACEALGNIGEKVATNEVINKLMSALGTEDKFVRRSACRALGNIGEKARTNEVISKLVNALGDENEYVRWSACRALENIGEKAATSEVIDILVSALADENKCVRWSASKALMNIGEKATTTKVISKLVILLGDERVSVRESACEALGNIGEKAATYEVISKLRNAVGDERVCVRESACRALGNIGKKVATNEVISKLLNALEDECARVRWSACLALRNIGEKAATNEVISKLMCLTKSNRNFYDAETAIGYILSSSAVMIQLAPNIITGLICDNYDADCLKNVSDDQLIDFFLNTENSDWLSLLTHFAFLRGVALTVAEDKVVVYGKKEALERRISSLEFRQQLLKAFTDQGKQLHLYFAVPSEIEEKSEEYPCNIW